MNEAQTPCDVLYHYTSLAGLTGILKSGRIRATISSLMNDRMETVHGKKAMDAVLSEDIERSLTRDDVREHSDDDPLFVACFSEAENDLGMWRNYGPRAGYAIGFKVDALQRVRRMPGRGTGGVTLHKVSYKPDVYEENLRLEMDGHEGGSAGPAQLYTSTATVKDDIWESEREWRLIAMHHTYCGTGNGDEIQIRESSSGPVPYLDFYMWKSPGGNSRDDDQAVLKESPQQWIDSIWIGPPNTDAGDRRIGVELLLRSIGVGPHESRDLVKVSELPIRY